MTVHHEDLLVQAAGVTELEGSLSSIQGGLTDLDGSLDKYVFINVSARVRMNKQAVDHGFLL